MARITIEDCLGVVADRFELVILAGQRARELAFGAISPLQKKNEKHAVIALREIAASLLNIQSLKESVIKRNQRKQVLQIEDKPDQVDEDIESAYLQETAAFVAPKRRKSRTEEDEEDIEEADIKEFQ